MKKLIMAGSVCMVLAFASSRALGGFGLSDVGGLALGTVTAASLEKDLNGGSDSFASAYTHYTKAFQIATNLGPAIALVNSMNAQVKDRVEAYKNLNENVKSNADYMIKNKIPLSAEQEAEIKSGDMDLAKGITKWAAVGTALGIAASQKGGQDPALMAAIPVAAEFIKQLPEIKDMSSEMGKLHKAQKELKKELAKNKKP
jgi:hypothetical protein